MSVNNDYVIKRKEIVNKLIKEANMLKEEELFEEDMMLALIEVTLEDNKEYFEKDQEGQEDIKSASIEIMNIIKKEINQENKDDVER